MWSRREQRWPLRCVAPRCVALQLQLHTYSGRTHTCRVPTYNTTQHTYASSWCQCNPYRVRVHHNGQADNHIARAATRYTCPGEAAPAWPRNLPMRAGCKPHSMLTATTTTTIATTTTTDGEEEPTAHNLPTTYLTQPNHAPTRPHQQQPCVYKHRSKQPIAAQGSSTHALHAPRRKM
ncbi:uncharacterized protein K452DRAFT_73673 [Aplosporella prunicola CBS 121167]|uniref:Uncharacterized protein n=1 Tax=Aplosporella prunicola CBS 121167 TaxID=1176127 RepID=A0A6A6B4W5_9PEZI|nr:uncharacterized protein K452DRAFT_73673 [Aplosporella prunicola CBS 121167]KAF2139219.1 hypothetical protein K452DRAFT_73673 [Aplosporella prunicola CBS 121167]